MNLFNLKKDAPLIGTTSTVPVDLIYAAGMRPVDLKNRFITHDEPKQLLLEAEEMGLPRTLCAWVKGIYAWCMRHPEVKTILGITQGDCTNTHALLELLSLEGREVVPFAYPSDHDPVKMQAELDALASRLGTDALKRTDISRYFHIIRTLLNKIDELTWSDLKVSGFENHLWLVSAADFDANPVDFMRRLQNFLAEAEEREPRSGLVRLGILGVPTAINDLADVLEEMDGLVLYNEIPHQFAMLPPVQDMPLAEQFLRYTFPYDIFHRLKPIKAEIAHRKLDGLVHYTQSFCYRQVQDIVMRRELDLPILTIEGDRPGKTDARTKMRLEAFIDVLR